MMAIPINVKITAGKYLPVANKIMPIKIKIMAIMITIIKAIETCGIEPIIAFFKMSILSLFCFFFCLRQKRGAKKECAKKRGAKKNKTNLIYFIFFLHNAQIKSVINLNQLFLQILLLLQIHLLFLLLFPLY